MTSYFILSKSKEVSVDNNITDQIIQPNAGHIVTLLPMDHLSYHQKNGLFEANLIEWCKEFCHKDRDFLDIGAHTGTYSLHLADYCRTVHAFEPQQSTYYALCGGVALSDKHNVVCHQEALGMSDQVGKATLHVTKDGGGSSLHPISNGVRDEEVMVSVLDQYQFDNVGFIKMDVEDNEYQVVMGGKETLMRNNLPIILFECNRPNEVLFSTLRTIGYKVTQVSGYGNMYLAGH